MVKPKHVGKWACPNSDCRKEFAHKQSLQNHKQSCTREKVSCKFCKKTFSRLSYLKIHKCKPVAISKTCGVCHKQFQTIWHLNRHIKLAHSEEEKRSYKCDNCEVVYKRKDHFETHKRKCEEVPKRKLRSRKKTCDAPSHYEEEPIDWSNVYLCKRYETFMPTMANFCDATAGNSSSSQVVDQSVVYQQDLVSENPVVYVLDEESSLLFPEDVARDCDFSIVSEHFEDAVQQSTYNSSNEAEGQDRIGDVLNTSIQRFTKKKPSSTDRHAAPADSLLQTPTKEVERVKPGPMTPNTRQRKTRLSQEYSNFIEDMNLADKSDVVYLVILSMKNLGLYDQLQDAMGFEYTVSDPRGRKMTAFGTRKLIWDFYHENATPSTITSRPARLKVSEQHRIQVGLDFVDTTTIMMKRGKQFHENNWMMLHLTYHELFEKYIRTYPENYVSNGTFRVLKPFYIRTETEKDLEMCCCKLHLHARWAIEALINCASEQQIDIPFTNYATFFDILTRNCEKHPTAYIPWSCTPKKTVFCEDIKEIWHSISQRIVASSSPDVCVTLTTFKLIEYQKKNGEFSEKLKPVSKESSMNDIVAFIDEILPNIINHRNHLRHYRSSIHTFRDMFDSLFLDIDFSENLKLPVKFEPQSMHWCHETVTVHSGIIKIHGEKSYHPYVSDDKKHDQACVKLVLEEMLETVETIPEKCIIESDNCSSQYKSAQHFDDIQYICNKIGAPIIRVFSVAGHGKGEVDHVGGLAKCAIRRYVGTGGKAANATDCKDFLELKFCEKTNPKFIVKQIDVDDLEDSRAESRLKKYLTVNGSDSFQVMVFTPNSPTFKASPYLCTCDNCMTDYGSCPLFSTYEPQTCILKKIQLRSEVLPVGDIVDQNEDDSGDFLLPDTYCAVAPDRSSPDSLWFIKVKDSFQAMAEMTDDYGNKIAPGLDYIEGKFMDKVDTLAKGLLYKLSKNKTFFFKESVVYPFVQFTGTKKGFLLSMTEYVEILNYVESNGLSRI